MPTPPRPARSPARRARVGAVALLVVLGASCGGDDGDVNGDFDRPPAGLRTPTTAASTCDAPISEPLDSESGRHLLPGAPPPTYTSDPPTSGPHSGAALPAGAVREPIPRPKQVGLLEGGSVLVQYRDVDAGLVAQLEQLADGQRVVVAPNPDLPAPVVLTAWTFKLTCTAYDGDTAAAFITEHAGAATDEHG